MQSDYVVGAYYDEYQVMLYRELMCIILREFHVVKRAEVLEQQGFVVSSSCLVDQSQQYIEPGF